MRKIDNVSHIEQSANKNTNCTHINTSKDMEYSNWCKEMSEKSSDGKEAYNYYQLQQFWLGRGL